MLGIGVGEMALIAIIALVVIGPDKFPDFAKIAIRTVRDLRGYMDDIQTEISKELKPVKKELSQLSKIDPEKYIDSLMKETPKSTVGKTSAPVNETKTSSPADPTDRQDNLGTSGNGGNNDAPAEDPYKNPDVADAVETTSVTDEEASHQEPPTQENSEGNSEIVKDEFDLSGEPPARLD